LIGKLIGMAAEGNLMQLSIGVGSHLNEKYVRFKSIVFRSGYNSDGHDVVANDQVRKV